MFIELHLIQNFAPSCLNRDDTNMPKDCEFGGYRRARISSQCIKRSVRWHPMFQETFSGEMGTRTKLLQERLSKELENRGKKPDEINSILPAFITEVWSAMEGEKTKVLLYLGKDEINRMADMLSSKWEDCVKTIAKSSDKEKGKKGKKSPLEDLCAQFKRDYKPGTKAPDIALFGRMVAENPTLKQDAACQVAHAISTHKVSMEMDFYTAVDDLQPEAEAGAGMMGTIEFNSSCFYRYSLIDIKELMKNLDHDKNLAIKTVEAFIRATVAAIPTGKQNSMAAQNPPSMVFAVVRDAGTPWSLANAFEKPVTITDRDNRSLSQKSVEALDEYWGKLAAIYSEKGIKTRPVCLLEENGLKNLQDHKVENLEALIAKVKEAIQ